MPEISDRLPRPRVCNVCGHKKVNLVIDYNTQKRMYRCTACDARVYCHKGSTAPTGYLANKHTRQLRIKAHDAFDPLWIDRLITRDEAYDWLARQLNLERKDAHIGRLSDEQLNRIISRAPRYKIKLENKNAKQKAKQDASYRRQHIAKRSRRKKQRK